jgi:diazepam-binding inhibitor (GABA receptor modulating acyl-CoA-binding protein)
MDMEAITALLATIGKKEVSTEEFEVASAEAAAMQDLTDEKRLVFYGLYKQGTVGDINTTAPWAIELVKRAKW